MKSQFLVNPFEELNITSTDRVRLEDLANECITSNLELYTKFVANKKHTMDPSRWKLIKEGENLKVFSERLGRPPSTGNKELTGSGLPMLLCIGKMEGSLDDLMFGVTSEDLETMRIKASYVGDASRAAVLEDVVLPTEEKPFQSLVLKWMEIDIPFCSTNLVKDRDYVYLEGTGYVMNSRGERIGYHLLHSVAFRQTCVLPNRVRGNLSNITFWRQAGPNTIEMYGTSIMDPVDMGFIRKLVVPTMADALLSSLKYVYCGQMRKLTFMLDRKYVESKLRGAPSKVRICTTCTVPVTNRRFSDFGKSSSTCKLCFGFVCSGCKIVRKLSFVDLDMQLTQCKVSFCIGCTSEVSCMSAIDVARARISAHQLFGERSSTIRSLAASYS
ncbi:unnamed protein product [Phytophthora fragariaefolia]|uniref:Unnamed protein product n=1 Tax=Phytophthora fragariaefolia TaxID=1490495 RepID=A0A9W6YAN4_9STRA|nr:unnamed protein product [Phytophthora fragariaefolia]